MCCTEREKFAVPVRALGPRAVLALPDDVDFGVAPVKSTRSKTLIVQNVGTCIANFRLRCTPPVFVASPAEGIVETGQTIMLELAFTPDRADAYHGEMVVEYVGQTGGGSGAEAKDRDEVSVALQGVAENVEVFLSAPTVALEPAYISLSSQKTIKVHNRSDIPVEFTWKQFGTVEEEEQERARLHADLEKMQSLEEE